MRHAFLKEPEDISNSFRSPLEGLTYVKRSTRSLKALFIMTCFGPFFAAMVYPQFYTLYAKEVLHLSRTQIGLSYSISTAFSALLTLPGGKLADRYGRRRLMAFWLVADSLLITLYLFAPNIMAVYLISAMRGSAQGLSMPAWAALQADLMPRGYRATLMGLFSATRNIISTPSPTIAGYLWESHEPKTPFYILASSRIIMLLILIAFVKETLDLEKDG